VQSSVAKDDPKIVALTSFKTKIEASSLDSKQDALDITNDMIEKALHNQTVPKYQIDALKNILKDSGELSADFEKIASMFINH
jgi:uncharacterized protein YpuA (DUF1002 family)